MQPAQDLLWRGSGPSEVEDGRLWERGGIDGMLEMKGGGIMFGDCVWGEMEEEMNGRW